MSVQDVRMAARGWMALHADVRDVLHRMTRHRVSLAAGGMAFFISLAIAPTAIAFGALAGLVLQPDEVGRFLEDLIARTPGLEPVQGIVDPVVTVVEQSSGRGFSVATIIGILIAVFAASRVVVSTRQSLDDAFGVDTERSGLIQRVGATVVTFVGIVLAVVLMVALALLPRLLEAFGLSAGVASTAPALGYLGVLVVAYPLAWVLYRHGSHERVPVPFWAPGMAVAAIGVLAASAGVGLYVQLSSTVSATLAVFGAPLVVLLWLYFVALAVLVGAEVAAVRLGRQITVSQQP